MAKRSRRRVHRPRGSAYARQGTRARRATGLDVVRSPSAMDEDRWLAQLEADKTAVRRDLPDLTRWFLATGVRIGEAIAVGWDTIDVDRAIVEIDYKILRVKGQGLIRVRRTKSDAGHRTLPLPLFAVRMLERRIDGSGGGGVGPLFPDASAAAGVTRRTCRANSARRAAAASSAG